ncbi:hypothetical protein ACFZAD_04535 [Streptomyces iakyrus]|uniref:hypothetical protein n=1 Tax=Streptomyces iakyrus TaxID=68219 RepID=UPI0036E9B3B3
MRTDMTRTARLLLVLALSAAGAGAAAGCGSAEAGGTEPSPRSDARAQQVAKAWDGSRAADRWRAGHRPVAPPIGPLGQNVPADVLAPLGGLTRVAGNGRSLTVVAHHGSCDDGPVVDVLETSGSVVLSAAVTGLHDGPCTSELRGKKMTVKLDGPVGDRIVLDAFTGRPVPYADGAAPAGS